MMRRIALGLFILLLIGGGFTLIRECFSNDDQVSSGPWADFCELIGVPQQRRVGQIIIVGNVKTSDVDIRSQLPFIPGDILKFPILRQTELALARLKPIQTALVIVLNPDSRKRHLDILIQVTEEGAALQGVTVGHVAACVPANRPSK